MPQEDCRAFTVGHRRLGFSGEPPTSRPELTPECQGYLDHDDPLMPIANSFNPKRPLPEVDLIFNGTTGAVFPRAAAIPISAARAALIEWLETRKRPTASIHWRPYDSY